MNSAHRLTRRHFTRAFALSLASAPLAGRAWSDVLLHSIHPSTANPTALFRMHLADYPALGGDNTSMLLKVPGMAASFQQIVVTRLTGNQFFAVTSVCTHQGCAVTGFVPTQQLLSCPCHGSQFKPDGTVTRGPATRPLQRYAATFDGAGVLTIEIPGLGYRITSVAAVAAPAPGTGGRLSLTFPTLNGLDYRVEFRAAAEGGAWLAVPFATTATGAATETSIRGAGQPLTVHVDAAGTSGFYLVVRE